MNVESKQRPSLPLRPGPPRAMWAIFLVFFAWNALMWAQSKSTSQETQEQNVPHQQPLRTAQAVRIDHTPRLDGTLNDPLWDQATPITDFLQREPFEGQ